MHCRHCCMLFTWMFLLCSFVTFVKVEEIYSLPGFQNLTKGYNKYLRPNVKGKPVKVEVNLEFARIASVSEENMDYTATVFLLQRWTDERLVFKGNDSITLDARLVQLIWVPDTYIVDSKKSFLHDVTVENRLIRLFSNGTVLYAIRITTTVACNMDLAKYPMDRQTCKLQLESWGYSVKDIVYTWMKGNDSVSGLDTLQISQYILENYYTKNREITGKDETGIYPRLSLHFVLKRNITSFILEIYIPSTLIVILSWISFWISRKSVPARACFGVTTVLSMTTILMGSRSTFPTANCAIKAIDVYLGICFGFVFGALIEFAIAHYCTEQLLSPPPKKRKNPPNVKEDHVSVADDASIDLSNTHEMGIVKTKLVPKIMKLDKASFKCWTKFTEILNKCIDFFTVSNPENIDCYSRIAFPLVFFLINLLYWTYYLYM